MTQRLEDWLRFHLTQSAQAGQKYTSTSTKTGVSERIEALDPRSRWYFPTLSINNLRKALNTSGSTSNLVEQRIAAERARKTVIPTEDEIEGIAAQKKDHCCFCLDNFANLSQESSPSSTPPQEKSAITTGTTAEKRPRSPESGRETKRPRKS